jgi:hypothetical protein
MPAQSRQNHRKPEPDVNFAGVAKKRMCLMCGSNFASAWSGERVCSPCKNKSVWRMGVQLRSRPAGVGK